jgi:hypothetical protein
MKLYTSLVIDEFDHFEAAVVDDDEPPHHGTIRLREFSIQGEPATLRRLAAAVLNAADLAERATTP